MQPIFRPLAVVLAVFAGALAPAAAPDARAQGMAQAVTGGKMTADLRYRYEKVDQGGIAEKADASTLRTRLGYRTADLGRSNVFIEFENVVTAGPDEYNSTTNRRTTFPVVADPTGSEVNQVYLEQHPSDGVTVRAGRQRIVLDNARFVGNVGWRQNEQTFDALQVEDGHNPSLVLTYAYLWNVNGTDFADTAHDTHLVHLQSRGRSLGDISLYGYFVNNNDAPATASQTYGARYVGKVPAGDGNALLTVEYARQGEMAGSGVGSNDYMLAELGGDDGTFLAKAGYEVLGGDGVSAFQTPLATKHSFDGWADQFLTTPENGLVDTSFTLGIRRKGVETAAVYHRFKADSGGADYGTEWDLSAEKRVGVHTFGIAWAAYNADGYKTDTEKLWVYAGATF